LRWADLMRRIYDIDMRTCPNCGQGRLEPIATILDPDVIARILAVMDRFKRAPPRAACRIEESNRLQLERLREYLSCHAGSPWPTITSSRVSGNPGVAQSAVTA